MGENLLGRREEYEVARGRREVKREIEFGPAPLCYAKSFSSAGVCTGLMESR